jgi:uncharacterized protein (DUF433 family)
MLKIISRDPEVMSGELVFAGTRVPVKNLFDHLAHGHSIEDFLEGFPRVTREQVEKVLNASYEELVKAA